MMMRDGLRVAFAAAMMLTVGCAGPGEVARDEKGRTVLESIQEDISEDIFSPRTAEITKEPAFIQDPFVNDPFVNDPFADDPFADEAGAVGPRISDPIEPVNRGIFWVNDKLYFYLLKPVARGYRFVTPETVRVGISNFFQNLATPLSALHALAQGKPVGAFGELCRFVTNSTVGVLGFKDAAKDWGGLDGLDEDMGQTFATWGLGHGFYVVLPLLGPSSLRDGVGLTGDILLDPYGRVVDLTLYEEVGLSGLEAINKLSLDKDTYEALVKQSIDPYSVLKSVYVQHRAAKAAK